ncbi:restriction endonuclease subunit S [Aquipseudomonas alcaligenes]|uniref:restriction endonuclease subunit S n=1 Tax=Aquipseudomonas alcaligenes TaxID=43263 RepID=UPI000E02C901|nr:restriction endonuclease subunit S [Pseudomonas alcaligenes]SUD16767.1 type I restriction-modification system subunit S [Pseudomonas alcaligenes]
MTFPVYLAYKDSGVEWLGEVPEHWAVHPLKRAIERIESGTSVNAADFPAEPGSLGVLKTSCVYTGKFDWAENKTVNDEDLSRVSCPLRKDTLIVSRMNTPDLVGATGLVTEAPNGIFLPDRLWQVYFLVNHSPEFLFYFSKSREYREQVKMACSGTSASMQNLGQDDFRGLLFAEPPKPEQTKIARFLDHETARIDALIEEQQRLIELLKEKRQAVISHAVTKGLDPTLPMKDSGVKWLGDVPVHWRVGNIKYFLEAIGDVDHYMPQSVDKGIPYVMTGDLMELVSDIQFEECKQVAYDDYLRLSGRIKTSKGDVVMARYATIGSVSYVDIDAEFLVSYSCVTIKPDLSKVLGIYLFYYFKSDSFLNGIRARTNTNTQDNVGVGDIKDLKIALPPAAEQMKIVDYLQSELGRLDAISEVSLSTISLAREKRSALISAAVTGKIDVRSWQPPASTQAPELEVAEAN